MTWRSKLRELKNPRPGDLAELTQFLSKRPLLMSGFNLLLAGFARAKRTRHRRRHGLPPVRVTTLPNVTQPREIPDEPSLLLIVADCFPQCLRYRVLQKVEQLESLGLRVQWVPFGQHLLARQLMHLHDLVIFYRVPAFPEVLETIQYARSLRKPTIYDIDDLIFDSNHYPRPFSAFQGHLSHQEYAGLITGIPLYREAMAHCDYAIASTPALADFMRPLVKREQAFLHRNGLDGPFLQFLESRPPKLSRDFTSIFYGSGSRDHDEDFAVAAPALARLLSEHGPLRLTLVGHPTLPECLKSFADRIDRIPFVTNLESYWEILLQSDINIAPLVVNRFADCKSEIKWLEAAALDVPSVVSPTQTYVETLTHNKEVLVASTAEEWQSCLDQLVRSPELRRSIAQAARTKAHQGYGVEVLAANLRQAIAEVSRDATKSGLTAATSGKPRLLFVNVFYAPQEIGGATHLLKNIVDCLTSRYAERYDISLFAYDRDETAPYRLYEYTQDGVNVMRLSVPTGPGGDWHYRDERVREIFGRYLEHLRPDLVHFHCIQRLTGAVVEAAADRAIPYVVTAHDGWWISDHQFLPIGPQGQCETQLNDPLVAAHYTPDISSSLARRRYLSGLLQSAEAVYGVSEFQTRLYRQNGIDNTRTNCNGIAAFPVLARQPCERLRLGFAAGVGARHKGFYLLKEAVLSAELQNTKVVVIDSEVGRKAAERTERWGRTPVTHIAPLPHARMPEFYRRIDVLMAPSIWYESFGLVSREAAAAGVWVVASDRGAMGDDIVPGVNGDIFSPDQPGQFAAILKRLDQDFRTYQQPVALARPIRLVQDQVDELVREYDTILARQTTSIIPSKWRWGGPGQDSPGDARRVA